VGSHLIRALAPSYETYALDVAPPPSDLPTSIAWISGDLTAASLEHSLPERVDAVVYLAQSSRYREFPAGAASVFGVNIAGPFRMLEYARKITATQFIITSSGGVYGFNYESFAETDPVNPLGFYLSSKYASELLVANYRQFFDTIVLRPFFVYGAGQRASMLVPRLVQSVIDGKPITLKGKDGMRANPLHVSDAVAAITSALEVEGNALINLAGPQDLSLREIGEMIGRHVNRPPRFEIEDCESPNHLVGDNSRMRELLVAPQVRFSDGVVEVCKELSP
jgi:UDP-glucose 4-epimerase